MATKNVSLPDPMKEWVEAHVRDGTYGNSSGYLRDVVRRDQQSAKKIAEFERLAQEGRDSGISPLSLDGIFAEAKRRASQVKPYAAQRGISYLRSRGRGHLLDLRVWETPVR